MYFGIGLCNGVPVLSAGLPVDVLSMVLVSEQIDATKHILIADTHAITNGFNSEAVDRLAREHQERIQRVIDNLGFNSWQIIRASEVDGTPTYKDVLNTVKASHDYIKRELTDMRWFNRERGVNLKLGWALNGSKNSDEVSFDQEFRRQFQEPLGFIYVVPGRTFDPKRLRSAPYFCADQESRILLQADENVAIKLASAQEKFGSEATKPYEKLLNQIVRLYDKIVEQTERGSLSERLQQVIGRCTR